VNGYIGQKHNAFSMNYWDRRPNRHYPARYSYAGYRRQADLPANQEGQNRNESQGVQRICPGGLGAGETREVKNNKTGKYTYMKMGELGIGLGLGVKDFRAIFIFSDTIC